MPRQKNNKETNTVKFVKHTFEDAALRDALLPKLLSGYRRGVGHGRTQTHRDAEESSDA